MGVFNLRLICLFLYLIVHHSHGLVRTCVFVAQNVHSVVDVANVGDREMMFAVLVYAKRTLLAICDACG